ncbi:MAG: GNAT family N-acetyltransferase, partial [Hyphomicrobiales bacterium]
VQVQSSILSEPGPAQGSGHMTPAPTRAMIRIARPEDAETIARIHVESWRETYPGIIPDDVLAGLDISEKAAMWANSIAEPGVDVFVGGAGEDALTGFGCCGARADVPDRFEGEFRAIYVLKEGQGTGLGRGLMRAMAGALSARGHRSAALRVARDNAPARDFYVRLGGVEAGGCAHRVGDVEIAEVIYGWPDVSVLL